MTLSEKYDDEKIVPTINKTDTPTFRPGVERHFRSIYNAPLTIVETTHGSKYFCLEKVGVHRPPPILRMLKL
jgi:hypothetical protein